MITRTQRAVVLVGLAAILFVQLCPLFEDPTPLTKVRVPFAPAIVVLLLPALALIAYRRRIHSDIVQSSVPLLELTCVRLC